MTGFHGLLAQVLLVLGLVIAAGGFLVFRGAGRPWRSTLARLTDLLVGVAIVAAAVALATGPLLMIAGKVPDSGLHILLGIVAMAVLLGGVAIGWWRAYGLPGSVERYRWAALAGLLLALAALGLLLSG